MTDDVTTRRLPVARCAPQAPSGHRFYHEIPRTDEEIFELAHTCEPLDHARRRLGPRLRCECGRGFGRASALADHQANPSGRDDGHPHPSPAPDDAPLVRCHEDGGVRRHVFRANATRCDCGEQVVSAPLGLPRRVTTR